MLGIVIIGIYVGGFLVTFVVGQSGLSGSGLRGLVTSLVAGAVWPVLLGVLIVQAVKDGWES